MLGCLVENSTGHYALSLLILLKLCLSILIGVWLKKYSVDAEFLNAKMSSFFIQYKQIKFKSCAEVFAEALVALLTNYEQLKDESAKYFHPAFWFLNSLRW